MRGCGDVRVGPESPTLEQLATQTGCACGRSTPVREGRVRDQGHPGCASLSFWAAAWKCVRVRGNTAKPQEGTCLTFCHIVLAKPPPLSWATLEGEEKETLCVTVFWPVARKASG